MRTPLQILAAAGEKLKICPETFDVDMGEMKGYVVAAESHEHVETPSRRVISYNGDIALVPGRRSYRSQLTVVWDEESVKRIAEKLQKSPQDVIKAIENRLRTRIDLGDLSDLDFFFEGREV